MASSECPGSKTRQLQILGKLCAPTIPSPSLPYSYESPARPGGFWDLSLCVRGPSPFCTYSWGPQGDEEPGSAQPAARHPSSHLPVWPSFTTKPRRRIWTANLQHRTTFTAATGFWHEVTKKHENAHPRAAAAIVWKRCHAKALSADNKHGIIYIHCVKAWKQLNETSSTLLIFRQMAKSGSDCKHEKCSWTES